MPRYMLSINGTNFTTDDQRMAVNFLEHPEHFIPDLAGKISAEMREAFWNLSTSTENPRAEWVGKNARMVVNQAFWTR